MSTAKPITQRSSASVSTDPCSLPVTVVIPVKNESKNLPKCLSSLRGVAHVVVVDSSSEDETVAIAREFGATVINFKWNGRFPKKRNWLLNNYRFKTEWVLFLDADEQLTSRFCNEIKTATRRNDVVGFWINYDLYFMGRLLRHGIRQHKLALFKHSAGSYEHIDEVEWSKLDMEVHEHPVLDGPVGEIASRVEHHDFRGLHHLIARHNEYSTWEARRYLALLSDEGAWSLLTKRQMFKYRHMSKWWFAVLYFFTSYFLRGGILDGREGFYYAIMKFIYFFEIRMKILEIRKSDTSHT